MSVEISLAQLAERIGGTLISGDANMVITGAAGFDTAGAGDVTYVADARRLAEADASGADAIIVQAAVVSAVKPCIQVSDPRAAFARALALFDWRQTPTPGIHAQASVAATAQLGAGVHVGAQAVVGENTVVGDGAIIHPHAVIGDGVRIGAGTIIHANATIYPHCTIGHRVIIHSGTVIGSDGLGFAPSATGWEKIPHLGTVTIEDDVEIGANVTIDRGTTGATVIGRGTKIDNLVHIAHNVRIGANCMIIAQVGIAGSTILEDGVIIAGQAGVNDHRRIGKGARLAVRSGVTRDVPPGATVSGYPAQDHRDQLKLEAAIRRLPDLLVKIKELEKRVAEMEGRTAKDEVRIEG